MYRYFAPRKPATPASRILWKVGAALLWIGVWLGCYALLHRPFLLPSPVDVAVRIWELLGEGEFWLSVALSFARVLVGFAAGLLGGALLAAATYRFEPVYRLLHPLLASVKAIPVASFILLALIWIRPPYLSAFCAFLMVLPMCWEHLYAGLENTDRKLLEMCWVSRVPLCRRIREVYLPSALPELGAAIQVGIGFSWKAGIAAEVLSTPKNAIGTALYESKIYLETTDLFAWTAIVILLSMLLETVFVRLLRLLPGRKGERA